MDKEKTTTIRVSKKTRELLKILAFKRDITIKKLIEILLEEIK